MDRDAWDALRGANSNDMAVMCLSDAAAIDMMTGRLGLKACAMGEVGVCWRG